MMRDEYGLVPILLSRRAAGDANAPLVEQLCEEMPEERL
jgi:hypothetical protein